MNIPYLRLKQGTTSWLMMLCLVGGLLGIGAMGAWSGETITPHALATQLNLPHGPLILDVRSPAEYAEAHIPGAINLPYQEISHRLPELADHKTRKVVVYCEAGVRAKIAELALQQAGFQRVIQLEGDMERWRQEDLPMTTGALPWLPGS